MSKFLGAWKDDTNKIWIGNTAIDFNGTEPDFTFEDDSIKFTQDGKNYVLTIVDDNLVVSIDGINSYTLSKEV